MDLHPNKARREELKRTAAKIEKSLNFISKTEKLEIFQALGLSKAQGSFGGHFYECPNGHIYVIGECGG